MNRMRRVWSTTGLLVFCCSCGSLCLLPEPDQKDDYLTTLEVWVEEADRWDGTQQFPTLVIGMCRDADRLFLQELSAFTTRTWYYNPTSGAPLGLTSVDDIGFPPCWGVRGWPLQRLCTTGVVTDVLTGTSYEADDEIELP